MSSWRGTECSEKAYCFIQFSGCLLSFCVGLAFLCLGLVFVSCNGRHPASPVLLQPENSWPTTRRFDDRPSLERARHRPQKNRDLQVSSFDYAGTSYMSAYFLRILVPYTTNVQATSDSFQKCSCRMNNLPSIYPHSAGCIYEGTKEEEAGCWLGSHHAACAVWHVYWWRGATSGFPPGGERYLVTLSDGLFTWRGLQRSVCLPVFGTGVLG